MEESAICIADETGQLVQEAKIASAPQAIADYLLGTELSFGRVGLEACALSQWL